MLSVGDNLEAVLERIERAVARAGRPAGSVKLLAISKKQPIERIREAWEAGQRRFGENHVQEFERKAPLLGFSGAEWHLVGHLQSNKARRAAELFQVIETVDSERLARRLSEFAVGGGAGVQACRFPQIGPTAGQEASPTAPLPVLVEVKLSPEPTKAGCSEQDLPRLIEAVRALPNLDLRGLMTMPPFTADPEGARPYFARLREWSLRLNLPELSMGMSHDFEAAIEEGSTIVRVGTAIFGERNLESLSD